ncbi:hypothetical protein KNU56_gp80 [Gordonia phage Arri]|uniref:Uncharacterized protein n=1 Tax=Gordonia phage Arri TaxID=2588127 RepID=A0A4Y5TZJ4_9CAUD|nr:hypothetical protein KNU56_gp80 [Gordonia phage Arri]QDB74857.1 hypothetical protein SEA_ARRI_80 [Gordonia phage Arri]
MTAPKRYRKKPVEIEAMQWDGTAAGATPIINWVLAGEGTARYHAPNSGDPECPNRAGHAVWRYCPTCSFADEAPAVSIDTLEGAMGASPGDFVIRGVQGEFYPCKPDIFAETYDDPEDVDPLLAVRRAEQRLVEARQDLARVNQENDQ